VAVSKRIHLSRPPDQFVHPAQNAAEESAGGQRLLQFRLVELAAAQSVEDPQDADQCDQVQRPDQVEEATGSQRAEQAEGLPGAGVVGDQGGHHVRAGGHQDGQDEDRRRVAHGEPEAHRFRTPPVRHQFAGGVVDGGDVVGVDAVAQAVGVGGQPETDAEHLGADLVLVRGDQQEQRAEGDRVHQRHEPEQGRGVPPVPPGPGRHHRGEDAGAAAGGGEGRGAGLRGAGT
jgi:hypothetical protein